LDRKVLNQLLVIIRPAFLQIMEGKELNACERDICRATLIREKLQGHHIH
ncbi:MAG: ATP--guanido phosphotransferase, partial [Firmicutes bacterium HGW-Firmicutes-13]